MKKLVLGTGGHPLTTNDLAWLQGSASDLESGFGAMLLLVQEFFPTVECVRLTAISGLGTNVGGVYTIPDFWVYWGGLRKVTGGVFNTNTAPAGSEWYLGKQVAGGSSVVYADATTHYPHQEERAVIYFNNAPVNAGDIKLIESVAFATALQQIIGYDPAALSSADTWHNVPSMASVAWIPTLSGVFYKRDRLGTVQLRGSFTATGVITASNPIFTIPALYAPTYADAKFPIWGRSNSGVEKVFLLEISTTGDVGLYNNAFGAAGYDFAFSLSYLR